MTDETERFRRLRPPTSGDLFAHFGIALESPAPTIANAPSAVLAAHACPQCGWYVTVEDTSCFVCGRPCDGRPTR
jgi:hypothetical protein